MCFCVDLLWEEDLCAGFAVIRVIWYDCLMYLVCIIMLQAPFGRMTHVLVLHYLGLIGEICDFLMYLVFIMLQTPFVRKIHVMVFH